MQLKFLWRHNFMKFIYSPANSANLTFAYTNACTFAWCTTIFAFLWQRFVFVLYFFFCIYCCAYKFLFYLAFMVFPSCPTFLQLQAFSLYDGVSCSRRLLCFQLSSGFKLHFISVLVHSAVFVFCCRRCWRQSQLVLGGIYCIA